MTTAIMVTIMTNHHHGDDNDDQHHGDDHDDLNHGYFFIFIHSALGARKGT